MKTLAALFFAALGSVLAAAPSAEAQKTPDEWKKLAEQGDAEGQFQYAELVWQGLGVPQDDFGSARLLQMAARQGHARAQARLGIRYKAGRGIPQDLVEGMAWLKKAADDGFPEAQYALGMSYFHGDGTPKDDVAAATWLERAKKSGDANAERSLGQMQVQARPKNHAEAAKIYHLEASNGSVVAQVAFGACLEEGRGIAMNRAAAATWYRLAAKKGDLLAKYRAGLLLQEIPENRTEAYIWLEVAGIEGISAAHSAAEMLKAKLSPEELERARTQVKQLAKPPPPTPEPVAPGDGGKLPFPAQRPNASGTGFMVSGEGYLVTNHHVVNGGTRFMTQQGEVKRAAKLIATDAGRDLAVLKLEKEDRPFPALVIDDQAKAATGDEVFTTGFPRPIVIGTRTPRTTDGIIASLRGIGDDPKEFQVSVSLQPGNSGGALIDKKMGQVVGVVRSTLGPAVALLDNGPVPRDINYAVKSKELLEFLNTMPEVQKSLFKPAADAKLPSPFKQAEDATVLIWVFEN
jgi:TPR repeat protein